MNSNIIFQGKIKTGRYGAVEFELSTEINRQDAVLVTIETRGEDIKPERITWDMKGVDAVTTEPFVAQANKKAAAITVLLSGMMGNLKGALSLAESEKIALLKQLLQEDA